jgi:hypothetical protein
LGKIRKPAGKGMDVPLGLGLYYFHMGKKKGRQNQLTRNKREKLEMNALRMGFWGGLAGILGFLLMLIDMILRYIGR